jgi:hypothetical protein
MAVNGNLQRLVDWYMVFLSLGNFPYSAPYIETTTTLST